MNIWVRDEGEEERKRGGEREGVEEERGGRGKERG